MRLVSMLVVLCWSLSASADLSKYVERHDPAHAWSLLSDDGAGFYRLSLVSQTWRGIDWKHDLHVYLPTQAATSAHALLFVGAAPRTGSDERLRALAQRIRAPVAALYQVPNQPLLDGRYEDDLIAETFIRFLRSGEADWPLLLPMTKSAVRAMDALQAFAREQLQQPIEHFVVSGASKRGWTSWLTAAVDARVAGVVPRAIDMLDISAQLPHQLASWGDYSEMLVSYTAPGLPDFIATAPGRSLLELVDPYSYRTRLTMPKLMVLGTNDRYWTLDALNLYWDGLPPDKHVRYVPNAGHGLNGETSWHDSLVCFFRSVASGRRLPQLELDVDGEDAALQLRVGTNVPPAAATAWNATAPTRDFRDARWRSQPLHDADGSYHARLVRDAHAHHAVFATLHYVVDGERCVLSTRVTIIPPNAR